VGDEHRPATEEGSIHFLVTKAIARGCFGVRAGSSERQQEHGNVYHLQGHASLGSAFSLNRPLPALPAPVNPTFQSYVSLPQKEGRVLLLTSSRVHSAALWSVRHRTKRAEWRRKCPSKRVKATPQTSIGRRENHSSMRWLSHLLYPGVVP
jgi:hypothetical protein